MVQKRVQHGSVGSALACCKAGLSSNLGSEERGSFPFERRSNEENGERPRRMKTDCMNLTMNNVLIKQNK